MCSYENEWSNTWLCILVYLLLLLLLLLLKYYKTLLAYNLMLIYYMPNEISLEYLKSLW